MRACKYHGVDKTVRVWVVNHLSDDQSLLSLPASEKGINLWSASCGLLTITSPLILPLLVSAYSLNKRNAIDTTLLNNLTKIVATTIPTALVQTSTLLLAVLYHTTPIPMHSIKQHLATITITDPATSPPMLTY